MGYGRDDAHGPNTGIMVGGEYTENQPGSVLTTKNLLGQWLIALIILDGPTQTKSFLVFDSTGQPNFEYRLLWNNVRNSTRTRSLLHVIRRG